MTNWLKHNRNVLAWLFAGVALLGLLILNINIFGAEITAKLAVFGVLPMSVVIGLLCIVGIVKTILEGNARLTVAPPRFDQAVILSGVAGEHLKSGDIVYIQDGKMFKMRPKNDADLTS